MRPLQYSLRFGVVLLLWLGCICPDLAEAVPLFSAKGKVSIKNKSGELKKDRSDVIVFVKEVSGPRNVPTGAHTIEQTNLTFVPRVLAITKGSSVSFPNKDAVFHNVFSRSRVKPFDLGHYKDGEGKAVTFDNTGLVKVFCNIHSKMVAYVLVLNNELFSKTTSDGEYMIDSIPKGEHTLVAWHRFGPIQEKKVMFEGNSINTINFTVEEEVNFSLTETNTSIVHKNKWGRNYKKKY